MIAIPRRGGGCVLLYLLSLAIPRLVLAGPAYSAESQLLKTHLATAANGSVIAWHEGDQSHADKLGCIPPANNRASEVVMMQFGRLDGEGEGEGEGGGEEAGPPPDKVRGKRPGTPCCRRDGCYGALGYEQPTRRKEFCAEFTNAIRSSPEEMGSMRSSCWGSVMRLSSACWCVVGDKTRMPQGPGYGIPQTNAPALAPNTVTVTKTVERGAQRTGGFDGDDDDDDDDDFEEDFLEELEEEEEDLIEQLPAGVEVCDEPGEPCTIENYVDVCCARDDGSVGCVFLSGDIRDEGYCIKDFVGTF
ncbi:hypothetical protein QBC44DRAFT_382084 [Cladorrhinum sp. PSN332]|nr:hypothetical protein QBC44DRAFT_382084 [Cladorrhinum sp. PSN332]